MSLMLQLVLQYYPVHFSIKGLMCENGHIRSSAWQLNVGEQVMLRCDEWHLQSLHISPAQIPSHTLRIVSSKW